MIITSCPLRISLVGGSTDNPKYLEKNKFGSVISFPSNLRTYVMLHKDLFGSNEFEQKYNVSYSSRESVTKISEIQNDIVRECFNYFKLEYVNCILTSDVYSVGSGLAASSAYIQALVKAICIMKNIKVTDFDVCSISEEIEKKINPLVGQQDFYGSLGGFKRIDFKYNDSPSFKYLSPKIFDQMDMHLLYTGIHRSSTKILESVDLRKINSLIEDVDDLEDAIKNTDVEKFSFVMSRSWNNKKHTSSMICNNDKLVYLDDRLSYNKNVLCHKLCGAGNGGYFLVFSARGRDLQNEFENIKKITISETGLNQLEMKNEP